MPEPITIWVKRGKFVIMLEAAWDTDADLSLLTSLSFHQSDGHHSFLQPLPFFFHSHTFFTIPIIPIFLQNTQPQSPHKGFSLLIICTVSGQLFFFRNGSFIVRPLEFQVSLISTLLFLFDYVCMNDKRQVMLVYVCVNFYGCINYVKKE